jgi:wyosine [tRNA(Phe)-imidazoG37] synthetase (radical SAM superfamily)
MTKSQIPNSGPRNSHSSLPLRHSSFVYGPVPSRRLGLSLGLNIIPRKTCSLDCVYCQCGRTTKKTIERCSFFPIKDILAAVRSAVRDSQLDFLTFSGEGEPTLNRDLGRLIRALKHEHKTPVAVITNSTLMTDPQVRRDLTAADLVVPSLDAADQRTFARVDRCHRDLRVEDIIDGLIRFRRAYRGQMWLEVMLVKGINDDPDHVVRLREAAWRIKPDRVHLNTVARPPAEKWARPMTHDDLEQIQMLFGPGTEIAESPLKRRPRRLRGSLDNVIATLVRGRPVTAADITRSLGIPPSKLRPVLARLTRSRRIKRVLFWGKTFFDAP